MTELERALAALGEELEFPQSRDVWPRIAERRRLRASLATICSSQGRKGAPSRKRPSARHALTNPSCAASSASAALPAMT